MSRSYERYLAKSNLIKPFKHCHLDRLSAVYSVINAIRWFAFEKAPISDVGANLLFQHILSQLDITHKIGNLGLFDIGMPEWANLEICIFLSSTLPCQSLYGKRFKNLI